MEETKSIEQPSELHALGAGTKEFWVDDRVGHVGANQISPVVRSQQVSDIMPISPLIA